MTFVERSEGAAPIDSILENLEDRWFFGSGTQTSPNAENIAASSIPKSSPLHVSASEPNLRSRLAGQSARRFGGTRTQAQGSPANKAPRGLIRRVSSAEPLDPGTASKAAAPTDVAGIPTTARPPRPPAPSRASARTAPKHHRAKDYEERRKAWRSRLEAAMAAPRVYTVPALPPRSTTTGTAGTAGKGPSIYVQSPVSGSPRPSLGPGDDHVNLPGLPYHASHAVPALWEGHSAESAPHDFASLSDSALLLFLQQAGVLLSPNESDTMSHERLVEIAAASRAAWEVERIIVGCSIPEDILRVPRGCTDLAALKAAWKKLAFHVHPDKCPAEGAADAMAIAKDAFELLVLRADLPTGDDGGATRDTGGGNSVGVPMSSSRMRDLSNNGAEEGIDGRNKAAHVPQQEERPLPHMPAQPPQPFKVRVKLKAVARQNPNVQS